MGFVKVSGRPQYAGELDAEEVALWDAAAASAVAGVADARVTEPENAHAVAMYASWVADALISERRARFLRGIE